MPIYSCHPCREAKKLGQWKGSPTSTYKNGFEFSDLGKNIRKFRTLNNGERAMFLRTINIEEE